MIEVIRSPSYDVLDSLTFLVREVAIGAGVGVGIGTLAVASLKRMDSAPAGLSLVASFAAAAVAYGAAGALHGSGFLAVYLAGLVLGSAELRPKEALLAFHDGLARSPRSACSLRSDCSCSRGQLGDVLLTGTFLAQIPRSLEFFNLVFFAVLVSTLIQGATVAPLANRLGIVGHSTPQSN